MRFTWLKFIVKAYVFFVENNVKYAILIFEDKYVTIKAERR